ncbi:MAG: general secretion pathway protein GspB [Bdellovibrio bacteriovorus]
MSYILEALRKSQQERDLGRVPTLDATGMFEEDKVVPSRSHWPLLAVGLAALAMVIALYAALREPAPVPQPSREALGVVVPAAPTTDANPRPAAGPGQAGVAPRPPASGMSEAPRPVTTPSLATASQERPVAAPVDPLAAGKGPVAAPPRAAEPLIEPPPPKLASRARPSGPEDGPGDRAGSQASEAPPPDGAYLEDEMALQRQMEADYIEPWDEEYVDPAPTPVPRDLIAEIEAFKREVRGGQGTDKAPKAPVKSLSSPIDKDPESLRLTPAQEADLPKYLMTAHVYDADQGRRFVLINGLKYREGEKTREGMKVERILAQGAVLSHKGNPFFVHR